MKDFFIFTYDDHITYKSLTSITVVFVHQKNYSKHKSLIDEIEGFFRRNVLTDKLIVILPRYCNSEISEWFEEKKEDTFKRVPSINDTYFENHYYIYQFDENGTPNSKGESSISDDDIVFFKTLFRNGSTQIFSNRGGLVESSADHHFVFPSGKHCSKFIRTGNVLINSAETFFLAIQLLKYFKNKTHIYCDTSSINVLPFAVLELKRRFGIQFSFPAINSFESYSIFENRKETFSRDALILISSSTSGNIIDRFLDVGIAAREQLLVLFFLGKTERYRAYETNIICNLTKEDKVFESGVEIFETHKLENGKCLLCEKHSRAIPITSDVFLTIQPKIETITLKVTDAPKFLSSFIRDYRGKSAKNVILKNYYRESNGTRGEYEVFIDTDKLFKTFPNGKFKSFNEKIKRKINTHIPANVKYLLHLPDDGSIRLAKYIQENSSCNEKPKLVHIDDIVEIENINGCVVIVASSIVTGRHLLHISRVLRKYSKLLSLVYFIGIFRSISKSYAQVLKSNLGRGKDGAMTNPVIAVQEIFCSNKKIETSWEKEKVYIEGLLGNIDEEKKEELMSFCKERQKILVNNKASIGLANDAFLKMYDGKPLVLQRGFAFWDFEYKEAETFQSEVYFTISTILTNLKNVEIASERTLQQSNYVRNLLSPENFHRFNDGVIQASILRAGEDEFFSYDLDHESSSQMRTLLQSMADQYDTTHGEALMEFLLALGLKKLRLVEKDLEEVFIACSKVENKLIKDFSEYVKFSLSDK